MTDQTLASRYQRARTSLLVSIAGLVMLLSFLWYLPGAYHAGSMGEYHAFAFRDFRFTNIMTMYVNHDLGKYDGPGFILGGTGIEYPALLSAFLRAAAGVGQASAVPLDSYQSGTPLPATHVPGGNAPAYALINFAAIFAFGLLAIWLLSRWRGAKPWLFAASPVLFLFAGYNWELIAIGMSIAGFWLLQRSEELPDAGRSYSRWREVAGFSLLTLAVWIKLFPIVFVVAALAERARQRQWSAAGLGAATFVILSAIINLPLMIANFESWRFFLWINQQRAPELSIWYWLIGGMDPGLVGRPDTTSAVTVLSLLVVGAGGLLITVLAWRSPHRHIMVQLGCLLLLWWLTFNKVYDPNYDMLLLFVIAILGAPLWLYAAFTLMSIAWWTFTFVGLYISILPNTADIGAWYVGHPLLVVLLMRLAVMITMMFWVGRNLFVAGATETEQSALPVAEAPHVRTVSPSPVYISADQVAENAG